MKILVLNCGSSTLKFQLLEVDHKTSGQDKFKRLSHGVIDRIGDNKGTVDLYIENGSYMRDAIKSADHGQATRIVLEWLDSTDLLKTEGLGAIGHRLVHGGQQFVNPTLIDDKVIRDIEAISSLAPLHNIPALNAIRSAQEVLNRNVPMVAVFDTAFHHNLPEYASRYAISKELSDKHHIRRYGFHGIAHRYMTERYSAITSMPLEIIKIITLQLGNGCSASAVKGCGSVDTSMGFTPLEGLIMGTRCGDIDPSIAGFLARCEGNDIGEIENWLNTKSGLLGVSARSSDMRELLKAEHQGDKRATLAVEMFCYRVRKYIGAYLAALAGADAIIFGGGIGENSPDIRTRICSGMDWCGITLDSVRNTNAVGTEGIISTDDSKIKIYVMPVDEAIIIAQDTIRCLERYPI